MGEEPEAIERDIEATRERMSEKVDALSQKADIRSRAGEAIAEKREAVAEATRGAASSAQEAIPSGEEIRVQARRGMRLVRDNAWMLALGAAAAGVLIGLLLPSTRIESRRIGGTGQAVRRRLTWAVSRH